MKKLVLIAIALISLQAVAQNQDKKQMDTFSPEEMATIQTKKMTLLLDLNESQQMAIQKINLENAIARKARMEARNSEKPSPENRAESVNTRLDQRIAMNAKMKKILNDEQYAKWEAFQKENGNMRNGDKNKRV